MIIHYDSSHSKTWSPTGDGNKAQTTKVVTVSDNPEYAQGVAVPCTLEARTETNARGVRRAVFKAEAQLPGSLVALLSPTWDVKKTAPVSAHIVVQGPGLSFMTEIGAGLQGGITDLLRYLFRSVVAVAFGYAVPAAGGDPIGLDAPDGPLAHALLGAAAMDVVSGEYGVATTVAQP